MVCWTRFNFSAAWPNPHLLGSQLCHSWSQLIVQAETTAMIIITFYPLLHCLLQFFSVLLPAPHPPLKHNLWNNSYLFICLFISLHPLFLSPLLLPTPDHSRSEMDLSAPGSEPSDDAFSLRSRSVPGFNETVSSFGPSPSSPCRRCPPRTHRSSTWLLQPFHHRFQSKQKLSHAPLFRSVPLFWTHKTPLLWCIHYELGSRGSTCCIRCGTEC